MASLDQLTLDPMLRDNADGAAHAVTPDTPSTVKSHEAAATAVKVQQLPLYPHQLAGVSPPSSHQQQLASPSQPFATTAPTTAFSPPTPSSAAPTPQHHGYAGQHVANNSGQYAQHHHDETADSTIGGESSPGVGGDPSDPSDTKKPRACESCRGLKVRCDSDATNPDGPCKRCAKAGRPCVVTQPTRKRQKKTDNRVAELEKKLDALTATLAATRGGPAGGRGITGGLGTQPAQTAATTPAASWSGGAIAAREEPSALGLSTLAREWAAQQATRTTRAPAPQGDSIQAGQKVLAGQKRKFTDTGDSTDVASSMAAQPSPNTVGADQTDVVARGILGMSLATELFSRYVHRMVQYLPGVVFPPETTADELRETRPILFLSVIAAASSELPLLQRTLTKELVQVFAEKVVVVGEKSLELVQAMQIACVWYWPPEHFEELKFYALVHMAAIMAIDLGLGRKKHGRGVRRHIPQGWQTHRKNCPDPTSIEARRAWLTSYFLTSNTSMALHRPYLIRWTSFNTECIDVLESSPDAAPSDKYLCHLVWTHKLAEDVGLQFSMNDPDLVVNIADARTQFALRGFQRELEKHAATVPAELRQPTLQIAFHVLSLYMHEVATQNEYSEDHQVDNFRDNFTVPLTSAHVSAYSACLTAVDGIFDVFLSMDVNEIRCLPVFNLVRVAYAVVILIKMYFAASSPKSELGKVIDKDNMKVEQHIEKLLDKFRATAADEKSRPAAKFLVVLIMLRSWFRKQSQPDQPRPDSASAEKDRPQEYNNRSTANAGLQLLSEIATNDQTSGPVPRPSSDPWYAGGARQAPQPFMYDASGATTADPAVDGTVPNMGPPTAPWLGGGTFANDFDYSVLSDGFQQAMDMTFAGMADGGFGLGLESSMGLMMTQAPPWVPALPEMSVPCSLPTYWEDALAMAASGLGGSGGAMAGAGGTAPEAGSGAVGGYEM